MENAKGSRFNRNTAYTTHTVYRPIQYIGLLYIGLLHIGLLYIGLHVGDAVLIALCLDVAHPLLITGDVTTKKFLDGK